MPLPDLLPSGERSGLRGLVVVLLVAVAAGFAPHARADNNDNIYDESIYTEFYTPPNPLPDGAPGDLIRTEPSRLVLEPSGQFGMIMANGTRIMYRSNDARGNPNAVTGTYSSLTTRGPAPGHGR